MNLLIENYFHVIRHLLNQSTNSTSNDNLLMRVWSPMAMILTMCFAGGILNRIIIPEHYNINSFDEMVDSGLKVFTDNDSWVWYEFRNYEKKWKKELDEKINKIYPRIDYIGRNEFRTKVDSIELISFH